MNPLSRTLLGRLLLLAAPCIIAVTTDISNVIAQSGSAVIRDRLQWAETGKPAHADANTKPKSGNIHGLSAKPPEVSILEAKDLPGQKVIVRGIVVTEPVLWKRRGGKLSAQIEDVTGGMQVIMPPQAGVKKGDSVCITGIVGEHEGLVEMIAEAGDIITGTARRIPEARVLHADDLLAAHKAAPYIGRLVKVKAQLDHIPQKPVGGAYRIPLSVGSGVSLTLFIPEDGADLQQIHEKDWYEITGILSQYGGFRLTAGSMNDVNPLQAQP